jgi:hypothetical protein
MWSLAVYRGTLFMGYNNGELRAWNGAGDPRGVLVFKAPDSILRLPTVFIRWRCCGVWGSFMGYR